jgi:hypothetical protein
VHIWLCAPLGFEIEALGRSDTLRIVDPRQTNSIHGDFSRPETMVIDLCIRLNNLKIKFVNIEPVFSNKNIKKQSRVLAIVIETLTYFFLILKSSPVNALK